MKTVYFFSLILLLHASTLIAQESKIKFGKINSQDLSMKSYEADPEAEALVLSKIGRVKYNVLAEKFALTEEVHVAIKILKEAGIDQYGNATIQYYSHKGYSKLGDVKAMVHLPDGTQVKVGNSQMFDNKENEYWSTKKIAFPQLVVGTIIEYQYTILSDGMFHPVDWFFQDRIPIVYTELTTKIPEWFDYIVLTQGLPIDKQDSEITMETVSMSYIARGNTAMDKSQTGQASVQVKFLNKTYINKEVPALKEECCITTMTDYYSRIRYQLKAVQFPYSTRQVVMESWKELADKLYQLPEWGGQFKNKKPGEQVLAAAGISLTGGLTQTEIALKLYNYINHNIQWNSSYGIGIGKEISQILTERSASSGDLNKVMCAALIQAGVLAQPVLVSTRHHGKPLHLYPFIDQFNHMVIIAQLDGKEQWIDLGDKLLPMGSLRSESLNSFGWVVDKTDPYWVEITPQEGKSIYLINGDLDDNGIFSGSVESRFTGYHASLQRLKAKKDHEKFSDRLIQCATENVGLSDIELVNENEVLLPFQFKARITGHSVGMNTTDKLFINPFIPFGFEENPFKLTERTYPIEMNYPEEHTIILNITLPEGYIVESLPEPIKFTSENNGIQVTYNAGQHSGKLNITMKSVIKQLHFEPEEYPMLKTIFSERQKKFNEMIILTKA